VEAGQEWLLGGDGELLARASALAPVPVAGQPERVVAEIDCGDQHATAKPGNESGESLPRPLQVMASARQEAARQDKSPVCAGERGVALVSAAWGAGPGP
jgi:hypothetical protein